ncbi:MAG: hypothetical protein ABFS45_19725 [Pseudomonadota bacterium]
MNKRSTFFYVRLKSKTDGLTKVGAPYHRGEGKAHRIVKLERRCESGKNIRNDQQLAMVKALTGDNKVHWVTFENAANVGMSWYLTPDEVDCLKREVVSPHNRVQWTKLKGILESAAVSSVSVQ